MAVKDPGLPLLTPARNKQRLRATAQGRFRPPSQKVSVYNRDVLKNLCSVFSNNSYSSPVDFMKLTVLAGILPWI